MRLLSFVTVDDDTASLRYGAAAHGGIVDLGARLAPRHPSLRSLCADPEGLALARHTLDGVARADFSLDEIVWRAPIGNAGKIWCIGVNYEDRNAEYRDQSKQPAYPSLFARAADSLVGHGQALVRPRVSTQLDYEGELVLVIGKRGRHISRERALEHVFGMTLANEGTVRDWLYHAKFNVTQGKNFDASGSIGPWIVTADELDPGAMHTIRTRVNGELRQEETTQRMIFDFSYLIAYLSTFATLHPGDLILTGTPTGAGARFDPPRWLVPGDVVEIESPNIGVLRNTVIDEV
ncbi:fumarylacetoacetate hydrolase family protein [Paraburkholderia ferrariae]|uniref:fumarylacetoacetate hydrolase family protein n=1 Tax=Paraburkholderia ferrariae TaxID=386056 RepID=UPI000489B659|nr:fumarylacetoacetate hydrolase family protein [Paraburkholderia ferrariae]